MMCFARLRASFGWQAIGPRSAHGLRGRELPSFAKDGVHRSGNAAKVDCAMMCFARLRASFGWQAIGPRSAHGLRGRELPSFAKDGGDRKFRHV